MYVCALYLFNFLLNIFLHSSCLRTDFHFHLILTSCLNFNIACHSFIILSLFLFSFCHCYCSPSSLLFQNITHLPSPPYLSISHVYSSLFSLLLYDFYDMIHTGAPPVPINKCAKCDKTVYKAEEVLSSTTLLFLFYFFISFILLFLTALRSILSFLSLLIHSFSYVFLPLFFLLSHTPTPTHQYLLPSFVIQVFSSGGVWHKSCFTCGALCDVGCNRVLARDNFLQHCGVPFCKVTWYTVYNLSCVCLCHIYACV